MAKAKTQQTTMSVNDFIEQVSNKRRQADAKTVLKIMESVTSKKAKMWGPSIIGFDVHHYEYASGTEGDICKIGFSPRAQSLVFYLAKFNGRSELLSTLGKYKESKGGCLYINKLDDVDLNVLEKIINLAYEWKGEENC